MVRGFTRIADADRRGSKPKRIRRQEGQAGAANPLPPSFSYPRRSASAIRANPRAMFYSRRFSPGKSIAIMHIVDQEFLIHRPAGGTTIHLPRRHTRVVHDDAGSLH